MTMKKDMQRNRTVTVTQDNTDIIQPHFQLRTITVIILADKLGLERRTVNTPIKAEPADPLLQSICILFGLPEF